MALLNVPMAISLSSLCIEDKAFLLILQPLGHSCNILFIFMGLYDEVALDLAIPAVPSTPRGFPYSVECSQTTGFQKQ